MDQTYMKRCSTSGARSHQKNTNQNHTMISLKMQPGVIKRAQDCEWGTWVLAPPLIPGVLARPWTSNKQGRRTSCSLSVLASSSSICFLAQIFQDSRLCHCIYASENPAGGPTWRFLFGWSKGSNPLTLHMMNLNTIDKVLHRKQSS